MEPKKKQILEKLKEENQNRKDTSSITDHGNMFSPKQLWSLPTLLSLMASHRKELFMLKDEIQKEYIKNTRVAIIGTSNL